MHQCKEENEIEYVGEKCGKGNEYNGKSEKI